MEHFSAGYVDIIVYLIAAILVSLLCKRIKVSSVLGYLVVGVLLGPAVYGGIIRDIGTAKAVGEFGVVFLMFTIGLELPFDRLQELRRYVFTLGGAQILFSAFFFTIFFSVYYHVNIEMALLVGSGLALSSTAVVLQVLSDSGELASRHGRVAFSVLLFQDFVVVLLLIWLTVMQGRGEDLTAWQLLFQAFLKLLAVVVCFFVLGRYLVKPIYRVISATKSSELFMAMTLLVVLSTSMATQMAGLSLELGAFAAGLILAETEYRHQVEADIKPYRSLLLGLFFMTVGMSINPYLVVQSPGWVFGLLGILLTAKFIILVLLTRFMKLPMKSCIRIGLLLAGGGEFIFVLFSQAEKANILTGYFAQIVYLAVVLSMALTPILAWFGRKISRKMTRDIGVAMRAAEQDASDLKDHIIIIGAGRVGTMVHNLLNEHIIPHVMIDMNMKKVQKGRGNNLPVYFGDGRRMEVFQALGIERAKAVVVTTGIFQSASRMTLVIKRYFPEVEVFVRVSESNEAYRLREIGANPVVPEVFAPSFQLASYVLDLCNVSPDEIDMTIEKFRQRQLRSEDQEGDVILPPWYRNRRETQETST